MAGKRPEVQSAAGGAWFSGKWGQTPFIPQVSEADGAAPTIIFRHKWGQTPFIRHRRPMV
jgi:hypothetical protein